LVLCKYLRENEVEWTDKLPLTKTAPYGYTEDLKDSFLSSIGLAHYATSDNVFTKLTETYDLSAYSKEDARIIMGVRYSMFAMDFSIANPYIFAEDVPDFVMQKVSEAHFLLDGITVETVPFREYVDTDLAPHLIGNVGSIYAEEWDELKDKGYSFNDKVGKSGIEAYAEDLLHGTDGEITYYIDHQGNVIDSVVTKEPIPGKTVILNLDKSIQDSVQSALSDTIINLNANGGHCTGGAAVVMNVKTGAIYASANHPTFDMKTYKEDISHFLTPRIIPLLTALFRVSIP
jgi:penicillin-binding protein 2